MSIDNYTTDREAIGERHTAIILESMLATYYIIKSGRHPELDASHLNTYSRAFGCYQKLPMNHWVRMRFSDSEFMLKAYLTVVSYYKFKEEKELVLSRN